ncbi:MAG: mandelate racemase [Alphaproteobacteria bacterium]|nr:mandelate racemase [Alphaproteobacteria bacterium]
MKITRIRDAIAPIPSPMRNSVISFDKMTISVVAIETDVVRDGKPLIGLGFCSNGRYAQSGIIRERLGPRIMEAPSTDLLDADGRNFSPELIWSVMMRNEKPGGHGDRAVAAGAIDMAVWDLVAKIEEKPLWRVFSERFNGGEHLDQVLVYSGGGYYYPDDEKAGLIAEMERTRALGYRLCKMKIGGADIETDRRRIEWALSVVGSGQNLAVDANGRFGLEEAIAYGRMIAEYDLCWYEEPVDPLDYMAHAVLAETTPVPIATGENLFSTQDFRNLLRHGGLRADQDWLQPDPSLCYGPTECLRIIELAKDMGWARARTVPHGGHQLGLHMAIGLGLGGTESYPGVFQPYGGFADNVSIVDGLTTPPQAPGLGIETRAKMIADMRDRLELR